MLNLPALRRRLRPHAVPVVITILLTAFQLARLLVFITDYGGIEHDSGWLLGISRSLAERGTYTTLVSTIVNPGSSGAIDVDLKFNVQDQEGRIWFFTGNGIGPASVLPDAIVLKLFGTGFWALRLGPLLFYTLMLLLAARIVYHLAGVGAIILFHAFLFFYPQLSIFLGYEAMGEVPTMCYILLGYLAFASAFDSSARVLSRYFVAGLLAGLAINAKFLGLLSIGALFLFMFAAVLVRSRRTPLRPVRALFGPPLALILGTAVPLVVWELYQLVTIVGVSSFADYQQHLEQRWLFVLEDGSGIGLQTHYGLGFLTDKFFVLSEVSHPNHLVTALGFLAIFGGGAWLVWYWRKHLCQQALCTVIWLGWLTNTVWFVGLAKTGWVRHFWFGLILATLLLPVIILTLIRSTQRAAVEADGAARPDNWKRALFQGLGLVLLAAVGWGFISRPHAWNLFIPDTLISDWQTKQIQDPYGASLPWIIIPRAAQSEIAAFINQLPPQSHVFYWSANLAAELPPLTGRINYPLIRRPFMSPQSRDVLVLGPSVESPWQSTLGQSQGRAIVQQQCARPLVENDYYRLCGLAGGTTLDNLSFTASVANFQNGIRLLGFDTFKTTYYPGESFQVSLYWQTAQPVHERYIAFVHLVGSQWNPASNNPLWGQLDHEPGNGSKQTTTWTVDSLIEDQYLFRIDANAPPGTYQIESGMYLASSGERIPILTKDGTVDHVNLFSVDIQP